MVLDENNRDMKNITNCLNGFKKETLCNKRVELVKDIDPSKFFTYLRAKEVFDEDDQEDVCAGRTRKKKAELFIDILSRKSSHGFDMFCEALLQTAGQYHLLRGLLECLDEKINNSDVKNELGCQNIVLPDPCPNFPSEFYSDSPPPYSE